MKQPFFLFVVCLLFPVFSSAQARYAGMGIYAGVSTLRPYHQLRPLLSPSFHYYWVSDKGSMHGLSLSEAVVDVDRMEARQNGNWLYGNQEVYVQWGLEYQFSHYTELGKKLALGAGAGAHAYGFHFADNPLVGNFPKSQTVIGGNMQLFPSLKIRLSPHAVCLLNLPFQCFNLRFMREKIENPSLPFNQQLTNTADFFLSHPQWGLQAKLLLALPSR